MESFRSDEAGERSSETWSVKLALADRAIKIGTFLAHIEHHALSIMPPLEVRWSTIFINY